MSLVSDLNLLNAIIIIGAALPTIYIAGRIKIRHLKVLFMLLPIFLLIHGLYHLFSFMGDFFGSEGLSFVGDSVLEPTGYLVLLIFSIYFAKRGG